MSPVSPVPVRPVGAPSTRPYARYPHLHGDLLVFTADDDVWGAPIGGGRAWRLTADRTRVSHPRISPDGTLLAWTSTRDGAPEAYVVPVDGGQPRRMTYFGHARTRVAGWTPQGEVLVLTAQHTHSPFATWAWAVPVAGGPPQRLPYGPVGDLAHGACGEVLLRSVTMLGEAAHWKGYRGGTVGRLWAAHADGDGRFEPVVPEGHSDREANLESPLWLAGPDGRGPRIGYLSDAGGRARLWSSRPDGSAPYCHTADSAHSDFAARNAATDGTRVVYHAGGDLWLLTGAAPGTRPLRVDVSLSGARNSHAPYRVTAAQWAGGFDGGPDSTSCLLEVRGTVQLVPGDGAPPVPLSERPGVRCRLPRRLGRTGGAAWVSDIAGADAVEVASTTPSPVAAPTAPRVLAAGQLGRVLDLRSSPDGRYLAAAAHDGRVLVVDVASGEVHELDRSEHEEVTGLAFSPDSQWLAWSHPGPENLRQIRLARTAGGGPVIEATERRFRDEAPAFTTDGRHLAFVSDRVFDPEYETHILDVAFTASRRPHLLTLAADTASPLSAAPSRQDPSRKDPSREDPSRKDPGSPNGQPTTTVDPEGLADRMVAFPVSAADYAHLTAVDGAVLWTRTPGGAGTLGARWTGAAASPPAALLERWDLRTGTLSTLREGIDSYQVTGDGSHAIVRDGRTLVLRATVPDRPADERSFDLSQLHTTVHPVHEWTQAYAEDERLMRDNTWRADLPALDREGPWGRYRPLLERIGSNDEFVDLLWETHGDLGCSHAYVWARPAGSDGTGSDDRRQGLLGADLSCDPDGTWRVARIVPGESSAPKARSPLAAPGSGVCPGDALIAVDGRPVDPGTGPAPLLTGTADRQVELTLRPASGGPDRRVTVVPLASEAALRYQDLIRARRARVRERGAGRLGYLHVPDMGPDGWAQLHRDLRAEAGADGLLVDFRENSGGHLSPLVLEYLARRPLGWQLRRGNRPQSYPALALRGPLVLLADELAGSDGDNVIAGLRAMGLGPVVGTRTWGGVTAMEVGYSLVDGTRLVHPRGVFWFAHGGWGLENHGVEPDIEVPVAPHDRAAGRDPQLDEAIRVALASLSSTPAVRAPSLPLRPAPGGGAGGGEPR